MAGKQHASKHAPEVEIDKMWLRVQQEFALHQHHFKRHQLPRQVFHQSPLLLAPEVEASAPESPLLVAQKSQPFRFRHKFLPINIVQLETIALNLVFDEAPKNSVDSSKHFGKQIQLKFAIDVFRNDL